MKTTLVHDEHSVMSPEEVARAMGMDGPAIHSGLAFARDAACLLLAALPMWQKEAVHWRSAKPEPGGFRAEG